MRRIAAVALCFAITPPLAGQRLAARVDAVRDGTVRFAYAVRPGVCGNGNGGITIMDRSRGYDSGMRFCETGPARVTLARADGQTISIRSRVGGRCPDGSEGVDLGTVDPGEAARYLLSIAPSLGGRNASAAIGAAAIADVADLSPELTTLVQNTSAPIDARKDALFWLGQSELAARELTRLYDPAQPVALREQWTFVLSQRHEDPALDKLIEIARADPDLEIRKRAMFWLGQSRDPKAIQFLHDLILR